MEIAMNKTGFLTPTDTFWARIALKNEVKRLEEKPLVDDTNRQKILEEQLDGRKKTLKKLRRPKAYIQYNFSIECPDCEGEGGSSYYEGPYERLGQMCQRCDGKGMIQTTVDDILYALADMHSIAKQLDTGERWEELEAMERYIESMMDELARARGDLI